MHVTETLSDGLKRAFTVVVPAADIESRRAKRLAQLGRDLRLPGFRPGKVPANLVKQRFGGAVTAEILEESVQDATRQVLSDRGLRAAGQPKVEVTTLAEASDLEFKVDVELLPDITVPDLSSLTLTRLKAEPEAETIERALGELARRSRKVEDVTEDRGAEVGDILTIDFVGTIDGEAFAGGTGQGVAVELGAGGFIPGFAEQLEGMRPDETRDIAVTFPDDYGAAEVAGKAARFAVTAKKLQRGLVPVIDDKLAQELGFDALDEVRKVLGQQVQREYDQLSRLRMKRELLDALAARADFPVPDGMVDAEFKQIWARVEADRKEGRGDADDVGKDEATLQAEYRAIAERRVRLGLLLSEIGRANGVTVGSDELARAMRAEAARFPGQEQQVLEFFRKNPEASESLRGPIFEEKVIDYVLELAQVTDVVVTPEELARDPDGPAAAEPSSPVVQSATAAEAGEAGEGEAGTGQMAGVVA